MRECTRNCSYFHRNGLNCPYCGSTPPKRREDDPVPVPYVAPYQPFYDSTPSHDYGSSSSHSHSDYSGGGGDFGGGGSSGSFD